MYDLVNTKTKKETFIPPQVTKLTEFNPLQRMYIMTLGLTHIGNSDINTAK